MNQQELFSKPEALVLVVRGNVPSFKNSKMLIARGPSGRPLPRPMLITKPELQKRMEEITESFVSQLRTTWKIEGGRTLTGCALRSLIALCVPDDDCWTRIIELNQRAELRPGDAGAVIKIERL